MQRDRPKSARSWRRKAGREPANFRTLTFMIPLAYNPDENGTRSRIELSKLIRTMREIHQMFSGYSVQTAEGWYRDKFSGKDYRDRHWRFDIDLVITPSTIKLLRAWKTLLRRRFQQEAIYMKLSDRVVWL